jgi:predicted MPP superfamily phosphohydrolase
MIEMEVLEVLRVGIFIALVVVVYAAALRSLVVLARRKKVGRKGRVALGLGAAGSLCIAYGFLVEPRWLEVTHVALKLPKLTRPLRIAQVSDLHCDPTPRLEDRVVREIEAAHVDAIVFTGDAANSIEGVPVFKDFLGRVARLAPTFAVRGNWDVGGGGKSWSDQQQAAARLGIFEGTGVRELDGDAAPLRSDVWIAGVSVKSRDKVGKALAQVPSRAASVFLCHWPDEVEEAARARADLYLCGHTHGGQVALPLYGALVTFSKFGKRFEAGLFRVDGTWLYVNRGVGMDGAGAPRVRFCARPELTIFDLGPE